MKFRDRCGQPVYPLERLEPLAGQHYHPQCFRCWECQTKLTLATFCSATEGGQHDYGKTQQQQQQQHQVSFMERFEVESQNSLLILYETCLSG